MRKLDLLTFLSMRRGIWAVCGLRILTLWCEACWQLGEIMLNGSDQRQRGRRRAQVKHEETEREAWLGQHAGRAWEGRRLAAGAL